MAPPSLRLTTLFLLPLTIFAALLGPPASASGADDRDAAIYQHAAVSVTNAVRVRSGRDVLRPDRCLQRFADRQAARMRDARALSHQNLRSVMRRCGLTSAGENVAYGFGTGAAVVREGWMRSRSHRANLLYRTYDLVAVGAVRGSDGIWYVAQVLGRRD